MFYDRPHRVRSRRLALRGLSKTSSFETLESRTLLTRYELTPIAEAVFLPDPEKAGYSKTYTVPEIDNKSGIMYSVYEKYGISKKYFENYSVHYFLEGGDMVAYSKQAELHYPEHPLSYSLTPNGEIIFIDKIYRYHLDEFFPDSKDTRIHKWTPQESVPLSDLVRESRALYDYDPDYRRNGTDLYLYDVAYNSTSGTVFVSYVESGLTGVDFMYSKQGTEPPKILSPWMLPDGNLEDIYFVTNNSVTNNDDKYMYAKKRDRYGLHEVIAKYSNGVSQEIVATGRSLGGPDDPTIKRILGGTAIVNSSGHTTFSAILSNGSTALLMTNGSNLSTIVSKNGPFSIINGGLNASNDVVFTASLDAGGTGIFTGPDPIADRVIATGDELLGSTISSVDLSFNALNDKGEIVFLARLADGRSVIVRADPKEQVDLVASTVSWNAAQGGVDFTYKVDNAEIPAGQFATVTLYWSTDETFDRSGPNPDQIAFGQMATAIQGTYTVSVDDAQLSARPANAKYLLAVVDPENIVAESDEPNHPNDFGSNNIKSIPMLVDVRMISANRIQPGIQKFDYRYSVAGTPMDELRIAIYLSEDDKFDAGDQLMRLNAFHQIPESGRLPNIDGTSHEYSGTIDLNENVNLTLQHKYVLAVADDINWRGQPDPMGRTLESDETNNVVVMARPRDDFPADYFNASVEGANTWSFENSSRSGNQIDSIVIHALEGYFRQGGVEEFKKPNLKSSHYIVSQLGDVVQMVQEKDIAYHAGSLTLNQRSIGIEHEDKNDVLSNGMWITDSLLRSSAKLVSDIVKDHGIPIDRSHIIGHNEVPGTDHLDPGPYWDEAVWTKYFQLVSGAPGTRVTNVLLPEVEHLLDLGLTKPGPRIHYKPLGVNFEAIEPLDGGLWSAKSNVGTLEITLKDPFGLLESPVIARSSGEATLTLFQPGLMTTVPAASMSLTGAIDPTNHVLHWHTDGFSVSIVGLPEFNWGPVDIWLEPEEKGVGPSETVLFEKIVRDAEDLIHREYSKVVTSVVARFMNYIVDPGQTELLVTDAGGMRTGRLSSGDVVSEIPGSFYFPNEPAVLILRPQGTSYTTKVSAKVPGQFTLVAASVDLSGGLDYPKVVSATTSGTLAVGEYTTYQISLGQGLSQIKYNAPGLEPTGFGKGPDAFVTSLYVGILGRAPEQTGLYFWSSKIAHGVRPGVVAKSIWNSRERRALVKSGQAPTVRLGQALLDAKKAWRNAVPIDSRPGRSVSISKAPMARSALPGSLRF